MVIKRNKNDLPDRITKNLFLGSVASANNHGILFKLKITHVLTLCPVRPTRLQNVIYNSISFQDDATFNILPKIDQCLEYIDSVLQSGGRILVHCFQGVSRSASIVIAYLMKFQVMKFREAYEYVKRRRTVVEPNYGFIRQLEEYEIRLNAPTF